MKLKREVFGVYKPEDVLPYIGNYRRPYMDEDGSMWQINMGSLRYQTFARSLQCAVCGIQGTVMILERDAGKDCTPHFNLYASKGKELILMTKDHICPRARGGKDHLDNMQTMCEICNGLKQDRLLTMEQLRLMRKFYDMFFGTLNMRQIMKALQCIFEINETGGLTIPQYWHTMTRS
jgi:5-methylcytosine-specific restriction endonuclease McrA